MRGINIFRANSLTFIAPLFLIVLICAFSVRLLLFFFLLPNKTKKYAAANTSAFNGLKNNEGTLGSSQAFRSTGIFKDGIDQRGCELWWRWMGSAL